MKFLQNKLKLLPLENLTQYVVDMHWASALLIVSVQKKTQTNNFKKKSSNRFPTYTDTKQADVQMDVPCPDEKMHACTFLDQKIKSKLELATAAYQRSTEIPHRRLWQ